MKDDSRNIRISVRNLVEFILRSGSLDNTKGGRDADAMQEGSRLHRRLQKRMGSNYLPEVSLSITKEVVRGELLLEVTVEGRADGIVLPQEETGMVWIDEIKCIFADVGRLEEMNPMHLAQAKCYAYIYAVKNALERIGVQLTYCQLETEYIKRFQEEYTTQQLETWFHGLLKEYGKWVEWQYLWRKKRDESIVSLVFPFSYREGQKELVTGVYRSIVREKKLFLQAPTGVGKTISTVFPAVHVMGEGKLEKIFYLTAKTIARTVAEETFGLLMKRGLQLKVVTLTSKEKTCILDKPNCNPIACERARGHYDRVNDAVFDMLTNETEIDRERMLCYAQKHCVCPHEMSLDVSTWSDAVICDYNYVFDPNVYLRRFFATEKKQDYIFLIDEAHNLVERARKMYSATLYKKDFLTVKRFVKGKYKSLTKALEVCNETLLRYKKQCDRYVIYDTVGDFILQLMRLLSEFEAALKENSLTEGMEELINLYFDCSHFVRIHDWLDEKYLIYSDYENDTEFRLNLSCMDPSGNLLRCLNKGKNAVFFSATLLPIQYYKEQLGGTKEDYAVYAPSPFDVRRRLLMVGKDVSTKYTRRTTEEYEKIVAYIQGFVEARCGNYLVFFPSYQMLLQIAELSMERIHGLVIQKANMNEREREEFLERFEEEPTETRVAFCVMGGIFSEGIDLEKDRLIGVVVVGTGLPMVCLEREIFREYYEQRSGNGFDYAYLYQGMNKVLQSAGRVIRTMEDKGAILLLDERFLQEQYQNLFPREWFPNEIVDKERMQLLLREFWKEHPLE